MVELNQTSQTSSTNDTNGSNPVISTPTGESQTPSTITEPTTQQGATNDSFDTTPFESEPGVVDWEKIETLAKDKDRFEKSAKYYQSQYMKKNDVPENVEGYAKAFRPDSKYAGFMNNDIVKDISNKIYDMALQRGIGVKAANEFLDYTLQNAVETGIIDTRDDAQKAADLKAQKENIHKENEAYLHSVNRTAEENDALIEEFINSSGNPFTADDGMKEILKDLVSTPKGYTFVSEMLSYYAGRGVPSNSSAVTGSIESGNENAMYEELAKYPDDGAKRQEIMDKYFNRVPNGSHQ